MRNIADSARASLQDVRRILAATSSDPGDAGGVPPDTDRLLDDVRAVGLDIRETVAGTVRPLPPGLATTVYRVVQEMLTNTIKHGAPDGTVYVRRDWTNGLVIEVSDQCRADGLPQTAGVDAEDEPRPPGGRGLDGMRQRLTDVGGTLTVSSDERAFVVRADCRCPGTWLPRRRQLFSPARVARQDRPLRVIVLTTFNLDDRAATAIRLGASGFLAAGRDPDRLYRQRRAGAA